MTAIRTAAERATDATEYDETGNPTPAQIAKWDAESRAIVGDVIGQLVEQRRAAELFIDTLPGRINNSPIDLLVSFEICAAISNNKDALKLSQQQVNDIAHHVCAVCSKYLETPRRRVELLWGGDITAAEFKPSA